MAAVDHKPDGAFRIDWRLSAMDVLSLLITLTALVYGYGKVEARITAVELAQSRDAAAVAQIPRIEERIIAQAGAATQQRSDITYALSEIKQELREQRRLLEEERRLRK